METCCYVPSVKNIFCYTGIWSKKIQISNMDQQVSFFLIVRTVVYVFPVRNPQAHRNDVFPLIFGSSLDIFFGINMRNQ